MLFIICRSFAYKLANYAKDYKAFQLQKLMALYWCRNSACSFRSWLFFGLFFPQQGILKSPTQQREILNKPKDYHCHANDVNKSESTTYDKARILGQQY